MTPAADSSPRPGAGDEVGPLPPDRDLRPRSGALTGLLVLAAFYTLYLARGFFLPVVLAILLSFLLRQPVRLLRGLGIPEPVGAALGLLLLIGTVVGGTYQLSGPAGAWARALPQQLGEVESKIRELRRPMQEMREATAEMEELADLDDEEDAEPTVRVREAGLADLLFDQALTVLVSAVTIVFLLYFLLSSGDLFLHKLVHVLPTLGHRKQAVEIARRIEADVSKYLFTITSINLGLGVAVALGMYLAGMPNPTLWGGMAALFNFVPYLGALVAAGILFLAALTTFDSIGFAFGVVAIFGTLTALEGYLITPLVLGRRLTLNPVAVFLGIIFWGWLWGVFGAVLAVPILATVKILCDNVESLSPLGDFLGS